MIFLLNISKSITIRVVLETTSGEPISSWVIWFEGSRETSTRRWIRTKISKSLTYLVGNIWSQHQPQQQPRALCDGTHQNIRMSADLSNDAEKWPNIQSMNGHFSTLYTEGLKWWKVYSYHLKGIRDDGLHSELFGHQFCTLWYCTKF